jgi:hypothetical protein
MADENEQNPILKFFNTFKNIALGIIAIAASFAAYNSQNIKADLDKKLAEVDLTQKEFQNTADQIKLQIEQKKFSNEQLFQLYREVKEAINQKDCDQQLLLTMIVDQVMADNIVLRDSLRHYVSKRNPDCKAARYIKKEVEAERKFKIEQQVILKKFTIDIFFLDEMGDESKVKAQKISTYLEEKFTDYKVRLRMLPTSVNARSGYHITSNEIRYEKSESGVAKACVDAIKASGIFAEEPKLRSIAYHTPNYISVFIRNP